MTVNLLEPRPALDAWEIDFIRTNVGFAAWRRPALVAWVDVTLRAAGSEPGAFRCALAAWTIAGERITTQAVAADLYEAVQLATNELEVALFGGADAPDASPEVREAA